MTWTALGEVVSRIDTDEDWQAWLVSAHGRGRPAPDWGSSKTARLRGARSRRLLRQAPRGCSGRTHPVRDIIGLTTKLPDKLARKTCD